MLEIIEKDNIFAFTSENVVASDFQIKSFDILEYDVRKKRDDKPSLLSSFEIIPDDANPDSYDVIHKKIFTINYNETKFNCYVDVIYNEENVRNIVVESFSVDSVESEANSWFHDAVNGAVSVIDSTTSIVPVSIQFDSKVAFKFFRNLPQNIIETF